ncbi:MAG: hypothetical protein K8R21_04850 [Leptospira sp.]|nr:hypothetical protein [Leptospira sp.]
MPSDFVFDSQPEEGYFQGWNFYFTDRKFYIFATFLVSNLGPNDLNHGISLVIQSRQTGSVYYTKEFGQQSLEVKKGEFFQKAYSNTMEFRNGLYVIHMNAGEAKLSLKIDPKPDGVALSGGKFTVKDPDKFVRADIPVSFANASAELEFKGEKFSLTGEGGFEHLNTNYEVYKYSRHWELLRAKNQEGLRLLTGGFTGNSSFPGKFFRTVAVQGADGEIILSGRVKRVETVSSAFEPYSEYTLPVIEKIHLSDDSSCFIQTERKQTVGKIYILSNVSAILRFFIRLFFAKPYQIHFISSSEIHCPQFLQKDAGTFRGIHSFYLFNK